VCVCFLVVVMCKFKHPNIIKLFGVVSHMNLAYIVMELAPHGQVCVFGEGCVCVEWSSILFMHCCSPLYSSSLSLSLRFRLSLYLNITQSMVHRPL